MRDTKVTILERAVPGAPATGWWQDGFFWRLRWGAEWRFFLGDRKRARAILQLARSARFQRFAGYFFALEQGRCRCAVRPLFDPSLGIEMPLWSQSLPPELWLDLQRGSFRGQRAVLGVELLSREQVRQIDAAAMLVLIGFSAHFQLGTRLAIGAPLDLADPGDEVHVGHMSAKRARERGIGMQELRHAKFVAGKLLGVSKDLYWNWPDEHGVQDWQRLLPRISSVRTLVHLITGTALTEREVRDLWDASEQKVPFHPTYWPNSKT